MRPGSDFLRDRAAMFRSGKFISVLWMWQHAKIQEKIFIKERIAIVIDLAISLIYLGYLNRARKMLAE